MISKANKHLKPDVAQKYEVVNLDSASDKIRIGRTTIQFSRLTLKGADALVNDGFKHLRRKAVTKKELPAPVPVLEKG